MSNESKTAAVLAERIGLSQEAIAQAQRYPLFVQKRDCLFTKGGLPPPAMPKSPLHFPARLYTPGCPAG